MVLLPVLLLFLLPLCSTSVISLNDNNIDQTLQGNEIVFVNFYADWCRFSQQLKPIFEQASENFKDEQGKVVFASVDADRQPAIAGKYHVSKYPTLKLFRNGEIVKKEYRSQRSVDALTAFVKKQSDSIIHEVSSTDELQQKLDSSKRTIFGIFNEAQLNTPAFINFKKAASSLREDCDFFQGSGPTFAHLAAQSPRIVFRAPNNPEELPYTGDLNDENKMKEWLVDKCIPLVREITFENAEELTEEGLPFLILFRHPDDKTSERLFSDAVVRDIADQKSAVNCLIADGKKFAHPLLHLGKQEADLPVVAIDSFRHMYLFPNANDLSVPGKLRQFVLDLHSGKLHREFHQGPDPAQQQIGSDGGTQPPSSVFEKLKPSGNRYTILEKDEL